MKRMHRAFSLIELLVAVTLSVVLMGAVLAVLGNLARDARRSAAGDRPEAMTPVVQLLSWDLANARSMLQAPDGSVLVLTGTGGLSPEKQTPTGRLVRVTYRCMTEHGRAWLQREQQFLDDPARPIPWRELVAGDVSQVFVASTGEASLDVAKAVLEDESADLPLAARAGVIEAVPSRVRVQLTGAHGTTVLEVLLK